MCSSTLLSSPLFPQQQKHNNRTTYRTSFTTLYNNFLLLCMCNDILSTFVHEYKLSKTKNSKKDKKRRKGKCKSNANQIQPSYIRLSRFCAVSTGSGASLCKTYELTYNIKTGTPCIVLLCADLTLVVRTNAQDTTVLDELSSC